MSFRRFCVCAAIPLLCASGASAARYQRCQDGKTLVWNGLRGVAQEATWSGLRDVNGYATGEGTLTWYRLAGVVNSYTGKMVRGKFEGVVTKEQAGTRLQATFTNGEKVGGWSEEGETATPGPSFAAARRTPKPENAGESEEAIEQTPSPKPTRTPKPTPTPTATPRPTPSETPIPAQSLSPTPTPTPRQTPTLSPTLSPLRTQTPTPTAAPLATTISTPIPSAPQAKSEPRRAESPGSFRLDQGIAAPTRDSLDLALPAPPRSALPPVAWREPASPPSVSPRPEARNLPSQTPGSTIAPVVSAGSKAQMISEFKKQTAAALVLARNATNRFFEVQQMNAVQTLPDEVSGCISALEEQARDFRTKLGYEVAMYECGAETATGEALVVLDQSTHDLAEKNSPAARLKLTNFFKRYPVPSRDDQKPLWRYLSSILTAINRARKEAEAHLVPAKSFESAGKKAEALREYQEVFRLYPNPVTADKIRTLQEKPQ